jgi:RNA polymerase sigma-70 factor, ECF subfamily
MRDMDEIPYEEIASGLGIGLSAAKMRIKRAREEFRRRYEITAAAPKDENTPS